MNGVCVCVCVHEGVTGNNPHGIETVCVRVCACVCTNVCMSACVCGVCVHV